MNEAKNNIKKTWEDLLKTAKITDRDTPLERGKADYNE